MLTKVLEVDQDLINWRQQLPPGLSQVTASELSQLQAVGEIQTYRYRTILTVRYVLRECWIKPRMVLQPCIPVPFMNLVAIYVNILT